MNCAWCSRSLVGLDGVLRYDVFTAVLPSSSPYANRIVGRLTFVCYEGCLQRAPVSDWIVCAGRALNDKGRSVGPPCGRRWHKSCPACVGSGREAHGAAQAHMARAYGWKLGPAGADGVRDAICPRCARPDPALVRLLREIAPAVAHA